MISECRTGKRSSAKHAKHVGKREGLKGGHSSQVYYPFAIFSIYVSITIHISQYLSTSDIRNSANSLYFIKEGTTHCWDVCCHKQQHSVIWTPLYLITLMAVIIQLKPVLIADSQQGKAKGTPRAGENKLSRSFITMAFKGQALSHSFSPLPKTLWFMETQS